MKALLATFIASIVTVLLLGATASAPQSPVEDSTVCPPTVFECCDGTQKTNCSANGGNCGVISVCGKPF